MQCIKPAIMAAVSLLLIACAQSSDEIPAAYVSPLEYADYDCSQLAGELTRVARNLQEVSKIQDDEASGDDTATAVGVILFWPALFFIEGDTGHENEVAALKGRLINLESAAKEKQCRAVLDDFQRYKEEAAALKKAKERPSATETNYQPL